MCFSAPASFAAAAVLLGIGTLTLRSALASYQRRDLPFAAIPLLFAAQQLIEGVIWLTFRVDAPWLNSVMTPVYSFFSHVLWPAYVPLAVWLIEPPGQRRHLLLMFAAAGFAVAAYLLYILVAFPVVSRPSSQHIEDDSPHFFAVLTMALYLLSTTTSPLLSTHRWVEAFGALALLAFGAAYYFFAQWFISVWCFFAALLSAVIYGNAEQVPRGAVSMALPPLCAAGPRELHAQTGRDTARNAMLKLNVLERDHAQMINSADDCSARRLDRRGSVITGGAVGSSPGEFISAAGARPS